MKPIGLYLHIPFCRSKCDYCDFYSLAGRDDLFEKYTQRIIASIRSWGEKLGRSADTLYFGGGTPSLLSPDQIGEIIKSARESFSLTDAEITLECNPSTVYDGFFDRIAEHGVNRISLGLQSASAEERRALGRKATPEQAAYAVRSAQRSGISNISLDLMLALPHQTRDSLARSVSLCAELEAKHISAYILKAEEGTPFASRRNEHPDDDFAADMYLAACEMLGESEYKQYEISNFCKDGFESRHNLKYWLCEEYLGIGPAAHSFLNGERICYERDINAFLSGAEPGFDSTGGDFEEFCMLRLRLAEGLKGADTQRLFGHSIPQDMIRRARALEKHSLTICTDDSIRLTRQGFLLSNAVISEILG